MVMSNKRLSMGQSLLKVSGMKKELIKSKTTKLLTLNKLRGKLRTQSNIKNEAICIKNQWLERVNYFCKKLHHRHLRGLWIHIWNCLIVEIS